MDKIDELIAGYLSGDISWEQRQALFLWMEESPENKKYFLDKEEIWFSSMSSDEVKIFAPSRAFMKFIKELAFSSRFRKKRPVWVYRLVASSIAVAAVFAAVMLFVFNLKTAPSHEEVSDIFIQAPIGSRSTLTLPDGTSILLNSGSEIIYASDFGKSHRIVNLTGEAYFNVKHNDKLPFIVRTGEMEVKDLGTIFNICDYEDEPSSSLILIEGKVSYSIGGMGENSGLEPGSMVKYNKNKNRTEVFQVNTDEAVSWIRGCYVFENEPLYSIAKKLERGFAVEIEIADESLASTRFYGSFDESFRSVDEILNTLAATGKIKYSSNGGRYKIKK